MARIELGDKSFLSVPQENPGYVLTKAGTRNP
jgi:hypothetical protein